MYVPTVGLATAATIVPLMVVVSLPPDAVCDVVEIVNAAGMVAVPFAIVAVAVPVDAAANDSV